MTYKNAKGLLLKTIDEMKPQMETLDKLRDFFDAGQREIALYYPICKSLYYEKNDERCLPEDCYRVINITSDGKNTGYIIQHKKIICRESCFMLEYAAFPTALPEKPLDDYLLQTQEEAIMALVLYVAAQINNNDDSQGAYQSYWAQYQNKVQNLCAAPNVPCAVTYGGGEI